MDDYVAIIRNIREQIDKDLERERREGPQDAGTYTATLNEGPVVAWPLKGTG